MEGEGGVIEDKRKGITKVDGRWMRVYPPALSWKDDRLAPLPLRVFTLAARSELRRRTIWSYSNSSSNSNNNNVVRYVGMGRLYKGQA